jgi:hypothetical protein
MVTWCSKPELRRKALELGAFRVLSKPLDMHDVGRLVRDAFESGH